MFDPFGKSIEEVTEKDLNELISKNVAEGFYIEYKTTFESTTKTSHSIASFANTHGGFYLIGVETNVNNVPKNFPGFSINDHPNPKEKIRDIIHAHISPLINFHSHLVELNNHNFVLIVQIFESDEPPHITKDGRIYRRNGEGKDPVPETDRYIIDKLYDKSRNFENRIKRFCQNKTVLSEYEENTGWIEIYIMTYPLDSFHFEDFHNSEFHKEIKDYLKTTQDFGDIRGGIPFNIVQPSSYSLIFRQTKPQNIDLLGLTYKLFINGNCQMIIPFEYISKKTELDEKTPIEEKIYSFFTEDNEGVFHLIDGFKLLSVAVVLLVKHFELLKKYGYNQDVMILYRFENTWKRIFVVESDSFLNQLNENGIPICQYERGQHPIIINKELLLNSIPENKLANYLVLFYPIMEYFGVFTETYTGSLTTWLKFLTKNYSTKKENY